MAELGSRVTKASGAAQSASVLEDGPSEGRYGQESLKSFFTVRLILSVSGWLGGLTIVAQLADDAAFARQRSPQPVGVCSHRFGKPFERKLREVKPGTSAFRPVSVCVGATSGAYGCCNSRPMNSSPPNAANSLGAFSMIPTRLLNWGETVSDRHLPNLELPRLTCESWKPAALSKALPTALLDAI